MSSGRAVVVGASHAGAQLVTSLRQGGWSGEIVLVGDEPVLPYQRPPLSKAYLAGKLSLKELAIRSEDFYLKQDIKRVAATVEEIDRSAGELVLGTGERLAYDALALCTGARPRRLAAKGADLDGVHYLRRSSDVEGIREDAGRDRGPEHGRCHRDFCRHPVVLVRSVRPWAPGRRAPAACAPERRSFSRGGRA